MPFCTTSRKSKHDLVSRIVVADITLFGYRRSRLSASGSLLQSITQSVRKPGRQLGKKIENPICSTGDLGTTLNGVSKGFRTSGGSVYCVICGELAIGGNTTAIRFAFRAD